MGTSWSDCGTGCYTNTINGVSAEAWVDPDGIDLYLQSNGTKTHNDALFNTVFGSINADVIYVFRNKDYASLPSSKFDDYAALLISSGKMDNCYPSGSYWDCTKVVGNLEYYWYANSTVRSAEWGVVKIP